MGKRLGLIIGINNYQDAAFRPLQFAENDARALAQWLVNTQGGKWSPADVQHVQGTHATRELLEALLMHHCINTVAPDDSILIYFAGHAFVDERSGDGYLACTNTFYQDPSTALHLPSLARHILARSRAAHILIILDCMHTGSAWQMRSATSHDYRPLLASTLPNIPEQQNNRLFLCSSRGNEQLPEQGERGLGVFMYRSILGLCGPANDPSTGTITLHQLHTFLSTSLSAQYAPTLFGQERTPFTLTGDLPINLTPQPPFQTQTATPFSPSTGPYATSTAPTGVPPQTHATATLTQQTAPRNTSGLTSVGTTEQQCKILLEQAQQAVRMQHPVEALAITNQVLQIQPQATTALLLKGQLLGTLGHFQEALVVVEQLTQLEPYNALIWSLRAVLLSNIGQYQPAFAAIQHAIELDAKNTESYTIKNTIMAAMATAQASGSMQAQAFSQTTTPPKENGRSFLLGFLVQFTGVVLGLAGGGILIFSHLPTLLGLLLLSLGLALLCVNAARGAYRYGFSRMFLTLLFSLITAALLGSVLYKPLQSRIFAAIGNHPNLFVPFIFTGGWLLLAAILPFVLASGGLIVGIVRGVRKHR